MPIHVPLIPFIRRRRRIRTAATAPPPPLTLTLVAAVYEEAALIRLTFDRPIDIAGLIGAAIVVSDGVSEGEQFAASGLAELIGPATVEMGLVALGAWGGPNVRLDATAATGIVAVDDGGEWGGVTDLELPFP